MSKAIFKDCTTALFKIYPAFRKAIYDAFDSHDLKLTRTQQTILIAMSNCGELSMSELARYINTSNEQATRAIAQLVGRGYVIRTQNEQNRRIINVSLTDAAHSYLDEIITIAADRMSSEREKISAADLKKFQESLAAISRIMEVE